MDQRSKRTRTERKPKGDTKYDVLVETHAYTGSELEFDVVNAKLPIIIHRYNTSQILTCSIDSNSFLIRGMEY